MASPESPGGALASGEPCPVTAPSPSVQGRSATPSSHPHVPGDGHPLQLTGCLGVGHVCSFRKVPTIPPCPWGTGTHSLVAQAHHERAVRL